MTPRIETLAEKKLLGLCLSMSLMENKTAEVWGAFGPRIKEIKNRMNNDKISMQVYPPLYYLQFNPSTEFVKWATVEVSDFKSIPDGLQSFMLGPGLYAVFDYQGSSADQSIFQYIFTQWLPQSDYNLDHRPHFEILGEKYQNNSPESEEEIWIPIKKKIV